MIHPFRLSSTPSLFCREFIVVNLFRIFLWLYMGMFHIFFDNLYFELTIFTGHLICNAFLPFCHRKRA
jgi:hypothetical protein